MALCEAKVRAAVLPQSTGNTIDTLKVFLHNFVAQHIQATLNEKLPIGFFSLLLLHIFSEMLQIKGKKAAAYFVKTAKIAFCDDEWNNLRLNKVFYVKAIYHLLYDPLVRDFFLLLSYLFSTIICNNTRNIHKQGVPFLMHEKITMKGQEISYGDTCLSSVNEQKTKQLQFKLARFTANPARSAV